MSGQLAVLLVLLCSTAIMGRQSCDAGFEFNENLGECYDVDECKVDNGGCDPVTKCYNSVGSFSCGPCPAGNFIGTGDDYLNGGGCEDVDECLSPGMCHELTQCINEIGSYRCTACPEGWEGSGKAGCRDINECELSVAACDPRVRCDNFEPPNCEEVPGSDPISFRCGRGFSCSSCPTGYKGSGLIEEGGCVDIDECNQTCTSSDPASCTSIQNPCGTRGCLNLPGRVLVDANWVPNYGKGANGQDVQGYECLGFEDCPKGQRRDSATFECMDIDHCTEPLDPCPAGTQCTCPAGTKCKNENGAPGPTSPGPGAGFSCTDLDCPTGFEKDASGTCVDINECAVNNGDCPARSLCTNLSPGFECGPVEPLGPCPDGFERVTPEARCTDIDECKIGNGGCHRITNCVNTNGSYYCTDCPKGTVGNPMQECRDVDECEYYRRNGDCDVLVTCTNKDCTAPGVDCNKEPGRSCGECPPNYEGTGYDGCNDINECLIDNGGCGELYCVNLKPYPTPVNGWQPPYPATINRTAGPTHRCGSCPPETKENQQTRVCEDIDECRETTADGQPMHNCHLLSPCVNLISEMGPDGTWSPGYSCIPCPKGYTGAGYGRDIGCVDDNECILFPGICGTGECQNTDGDYACIERGACPPGFKKIGEGIDATCVDINECVEGIDPTNPMLPKCQIGDTQCDPENGGCDVNVQCYNANGTRYCGQCPIGFEGGEKLVEASTPPPDAGPIRDNGWPYHLTEYSTCRDINECEKFSDTNGGCHELQVCVNQIGSHKCGACTERYRSHPLLGCEDIDECAEGTDECHDLASCINVPGDYVCRSCAAGYKFQESAEGQKLGRGSSGCEDVDECAIKTANCKATDTCVNTQGSYVCVSPDATCPESPKAVISVDVVLEDGTVQRVVAPSTAVPYGSDPKRQFALNADRSVGTGLSFFWKFTGSADAEDEPKLKSVVAQSAYVSKIYRKGTYTFQVLVTDTCGQSSAANVSLRRDTTAPDAPPVPVPVIVAPPIPSTTLTDSTDSPTPSGASTVETTSPVLPRPARVTFDDSSIRTPPPTSQPTQFLSGACHDETSVTMLGMMVLTIFTVAGL